LRTDIFNTKRVAVAVVLGGGLALGVAGLAQAADPTPSGSAAPSASAEAGGPKAGRGAPREHKPHLDGTVKSITDTTIMITDRDGFTRQINITTKPDGVAVGTRIHAEGAVNKDGVSLDATEVKVAPERADGRPGGGPGGRGGPGHRGGPRGEGAPPAAPGETAPSAPAAPSGVPSAPSAPAPSQS
jgi:hypothetical protein